VNYEKDCQWLESWIIYTCHWGAYLLPNPPPQLQWYTPNSQLLDLSIFCALTSPPQICAHLLTEFCTKLWLIIVIIIKEQNNNNNNTTIYKEPQYRKGVQTCFSRRLQWLVSSPSCSKLGTGIRGF